MTDSVDVMDFEGHLRDFLDDMFVVSLNGLLSLVGPDEAEYRIRLCGTYWH